MTLPASGYLENAARTNAEMQQAFEDLRDAVAESPGGSARTELTIASGAIVPPAGAGGGHHTVDTEGNAASDDLATITTTNTPEGRVVRLYAENTSRVATLKHASGGAGQMLMRDGADFVFSALYEWIEFQLRSTDWVEVARSRTAAELAAATTIADADLFRFLIASTGVEKTLTAAYMRYLLARRVLVGEQTASASATIDFDLNTYPSLFDGTYTSVEFELLSVLPATDDVYVIMQIGTGATPTWQSGAGAYAYVGRLQSQSGGQDLSPTLNGYSTGLPISMPVAGGGIGTGSGNAETLNAWIDAPKIGRAEAIYFNWRSAYRTAPLIVNQMSAAGHYGLNTAITGVRFLLSSGNIASGLFRAWGIR